MRLCLGVMRSTLTQDFLTVAAEPPLSIRIRFIADKYVLNAMGYNRDVYYQLEELAILPTSPRTNIWTLKELPFLIQSFKDLRTEKPAIVYCIVIPCFKFNYWHQVDSMSVFTSFSLSNNISGIPPEQINNVFKWLISFKWSGDLEIYTGASNINCPTNTGIKNSTLHLTSSVQKP